MKRVRLGFLSLLFSMIFSGMVFADDHGNSCSSATTVSVNSTTKGSIETGGEYDYFRVQVSSSGTLTAYTTGSTDTYGYLKDSGCSDLTSNDESGSVNFRISHSISAGTYYIAVRHYSLTRTGSYTMHVESIGGDDSGGAGNASSVNTVSVPSRNPWTDTGVTVTTGQSLTITASGTWSMDSNRYVGPDGDSSPASSAYPLPGGNLHSLIGRIGSTVFYVGSSFSRTAPASGTLELGMNDSYFADNAGSLTATITVDVGSQINVTAPAGGETWYTGSTYRIRWSSSSSIRWVQIQVSWNDGEAFSIQNFPDYVTASQGYYDWTIPTNNSSLISNRCRIKVIDYDGSGIFGVSGRFTIQNNTPPSSLGEAADNTDLSWTTGVNADWVGQTSVSYYGGDAAQSGTISHTQSSWIQTTVTGTGTLTFYWKVSSESGWDYLRFYIDGQEQTRISGDVNWTQKTYNISFGSHTLKWEYTKDGSVNSGSDKGWLDKVTFQHQPISEDSFEPDDTMNTAKSINLSSPQSHTFYPTGDVDWVQFIRPSAGTYILTVYDVTVDLGFDAWVETGLLPPVKTDTGWVNNGATLAIQILTNGNSNFYLKFYARTSDHTGEYKIKVDRNTNILGEAVDNLSLNWQTGGNADWVSQTSVSYYGSDAAQSGTISHTQSSWIQTTVTGPGTLTFYWKVSSESGWDYLRFYIDGQEQTRISGDVNWTQKTYNISSGSHTLKWEYTKDGSVNSGSDRGWLDFVRFH